jgi:uncharacterized coiled-coil protein SlyX
MMNNQDILGMDSALAAAKEMPYGANMPISAALVIEMVERIAELVARIAKAELAFAVVEGRNAELEKELADTESNLASLQSKFEDIEAVFCDEDGCLIIEPFNGEGLSKWYKALKESK